jgi:hypothetical protein
MLVIDCYFRRFLFAQKLPIAIGLTLLDRGAQSKATQCGCHPKGHPYFSGFKIGLRRYGAIVENMQIETEAHGAHRRVEVCPSGFIDIITARSEKESVGWVNATIAPP